MADPKARFVALQDLAGVAVVVPEGVMEDLEDQILRPLLAEEVEDLRLIHDLDHLVQQIAARVVGYRVLLLRPRP